MRAVPPERIFMLERDSSSVKILLSNMYIFERSPDLPLALSYYWYSFLLPLLLWWFTFTLRVSRTPLFKRNGFSKDWHSLSLSLCLLPPFPWDSSKSLFTTMHSLLRQQDFLPICTWIVNITFYSHRAYLTANHFKAAFPHIFPFPLKFSNEKIPLLKNSLVQSNYVSSYVVRLQVISL